MRNEMSGKVIMEHVRAKRRAYAGLKTKKAAKSSALDEFCLLTGAGRKYAIKLLAGNRKCRGHKGRSKTCTPESEELFLRLWRASGWMRPQCLAAVARRRMDALRELGHVDAAAEKFLHMCASTIEHILRRNPREAPRRQQERQRPRRAKERLHRANTSATTASTILI